MIHFVKHLQHAKGEGLLREVCSQHSQPTDHVLISGSHVTVTQASSVPMSSPASGGQNSSFAAALRKLAKNAMSPGSQSPVSVLQPPSNSTMSPVKTNGM